MIPDHLKTLDDFGLGHLPILEIPTFRELDAMCRELGVVGGTYADPDGGAWSPRRAYLDAGEVVYTSPAVRESLTGRYPHPGANEYTTARDRAGDHAAAMDENRTERQR